MAVLRSLDAALVFFGFANLAATVRLWLQSAPGQSRRAWPFGVIAYGVAVLAELSFTHARVAPFVLLLAAAVLAAVRSRWVHTLHPAGFQSVVTTVLARLAAAGWLVALAVTAQVSPLIRTVLSVLAGAVAVSTPVELVDKYLLQEVLCRGSRPVPAARRPSGFMVSVHVPCYAEPPDVVINTLDALAGQTHGDFEVLVIDNNTADPALWRPVQEYCAELGDRFRFHHVDRLAGAKAGALNFALDRTDPRAELVAVVDADYQAEPNFLTALTGHFEDDRLAFVQTRHDYRDWHRSGHLRSAFWEYRLMYSTYMVSRSTWNSALTTGTMCVIRRQALESVGRWAQWCTTEDSELAVRLHAAGYTGIYLPVTFGRGLIPEKFSGYRRQRYRWIFGPTQELRRHWRLYMPRRWSGGSRLSPSQKLLFAHHGVRELLLSMSDALITACVAALAAVAILSPSTSTVPLSAVAALIAINLAGRLLTWCVFRQAVGCPPAEVARANMTRLALGGISQAAGLTGWLSSSGQFHRTSKFPAARNRAGALRTSAVEALLGLAALALATATIACDPGSPLNLLLGLLLLIRVQRWLAAPIVALLAERRSEVPENVAVRPRPVLARRGPQS